MSQAKPVTGEDFEQEVLKHPGLVLVDFWGPGCGPCRMMAPVVDALAAENEGGVKIVKVDISQAGDVADEYGIQSIPTFLLFKNGNVVEQFMGVVQKPKLQAAIDENLA